MSKRIIIIKNGKSLYCIQTIEYIPRYWVGHYNGCVKYEFYDKLLYTINNDS